LDSHKSDVSFEKNCKAKNSCAFANGRYIAQYSAGGKL